MSEKLDRRARKSREAIFRAFEALLEEKSYGSISATDIIHEADVGRSTFYAHFSTKDALLDELCRNIFQHIVSPGPEEGHSFSAGDPEQQLTHALYHLQEQQERLAPLFRSPSRSLFWSAFQTEVEGYFGSALKTAGSSPTGIPDDLYAHYLATTYTELAQWWFGQGLSHKPEQIFKMFRTLTAL